MTVTDTINRIAVTANDFAAAAGVGGVETAGAIISYLAAHPDQVEAFMSGGSSFLLDLDARLIHAQGLLTWHRKDGKVVTPEEMRAYLALREACQTKEGFEALIREQLRTNIGDDADTYTEADYVLDLAEPGWPDSGIWMGIMVRLHEGGELTPREREQAIAYYSCEDGAEVPIAMRFTGSHINRDGEFQSDKYPTCPAGKVPLSVKDPTAQDLLWQYAKRRRVIDSEFSDDLEAALKAAGYKAE